MKTDLLPPGYTAPKNAALAHKGKAAAGAIPLGKIPGQEKAVTGAAAAVGQDYKVELSPAAKNPAPATTSSAPSVPSAPKLPDLPKPEVFSSKENVVAEKAREEAKKEAVSKAKETAKAEAEVKKGSIKKPFIAFISGWQYMSSPSKSEGSYAGVGRMAESVEGARIYGWDQTDEIIEQVEKTHPDYPVILVGHSFGGDTAVNVANQLDSLEKGFRKVDLLVTLDAVGFNNDIIPQNVTEHLNVFGERDVFFLNDGPHVARRHEKTDVKNILSPLEHTELDDAKDVQYEIVTAIERKLGK
jgi:hypothetical protein